MEIVHFLGLSATGKETLVNSILSGDQEVRRRFRIDGEAIGILDPHHYKRKQCYLDSMSADAIATKWMDATPESVSFLLEQRWCQHVIHKWQLGSHKLVQDLRNDGQFRAIIHRAFALRLSDSDWEVRLKSRNLTPRPECCGNEGFTDGKGESWGWLQERIAELEMWLHLKVEVITASRERMYPAWSGE